MFLQSCFKGTGSIGCLLILLPIYARSYVLTRFVNEKSFDDLLLFEEFTLWSPSHKSKTECAQDCHRNPSCTIFSISLGANICQLYGDVVYPDVATAPGLSGRRYYVYIKEGCPYENEFVILRQSNQCIRIFNIAMYYHEVLAECDKYQARPIVLEDENKANATLDLLQKNGNTDNRFLIGAQVNITHPNFIWADGQTLTRNWWKSGDPNNGGVGEYCVTMRQNVMEDVACFVSAWFICEIPL